MEKINLCGIAGFINSKRQNVEPILRAMAATLSHRGPNDDGIWFDQDIGIALAHRRLSILDLSPEGHQPMLSPNGRYVIVYNGEVYNFKILRDELIKNGYHFRGHSDTEVMLAAIEAWGVEAAVNRFIGMFAFALWDRSEQQLYLVRDRLGIKPLYYGWVGGTFVFASELKALCAYPSFQQSINRSALALYFRYAYFPNPYTIYDGISKLSPGHILQLSTDNNPRVWAYWRIAEKKAPLSGDTLVESLDSLLKDAIGIRMIADVPLGAFLSGGIDSSTVVALMQAQSIRPIKTFAIGFDEPNYNEAEDAKAVANHLGTEHTELYVTFQEAMDVIPRLPTLYDEPFADVSQIPTFLVSQLARQHVTVSLSGDGGDELFHGYERYAFAPRIWRKIGWIPYHLRLGARRLLRRDRSQVIRHLRETLAARNYDEYYKQIMSHWQDSIVIGGEEPITAEPMPFMSDLAQRGSFIDLLTFLPEDILTKVDRASMGVSLEARVPLLDHRIVEFAWNLSPALKIREGKGKWILRQLLYKYVPKALVERPKKGFGVPIGEWLRGPLRDWAEEFISESRLKNDGFLRSKPVREKWEEHLSGKINWSNQLWTVLMFQAWLDTI
ncbi:MAG: asparagine synthase (glutamine-hydrolyzing) [Pseudomonadota bacterium]